MYLHVFTNSKLRFAIALASVVFSLVSCVSSSRKSAETLSPTRSSEYRLIDDNCDEENCLLITQAEQDYPIGVATVTGYYAEIERSAFEQTNRCDSFIITEGPAVLIQSILSLIKQGNTVYMKNDVGQPVISLDLSRLADPEKQRFLSSSALQTVSIVLLATSPTYQGAPVCYSRFEILRLK